MSKRSLTLKPEDTIKSLKKKMLSKEYLPIRDRIRAVVLALKGKKDREIGEYFGYSIQWVKKWIGRYKGGGVDGFFEAERPGAPPKLTEDQVMELYEIILTGPDKEDILSRYRISDLQKLVLERFGVHYSIGGLHALMKRMKLGHVKPRPHHPKNNPELMEKWKGTAEDFISSKKKAYQEKK